MKSSNSLLVRPQVFGLAAGIFLLLCAGVLRAEEIFQMPENAKSELVKKFVTLSPGKTAELARIEGEGVIRRIWCTFIPKDPETNRLLGRELCLNIYWDQSKKPAVSVPLADFFCQPMELQAIENKFFTASNDLCVFNSLIPMPFRKEARFEIVNDSEEKLLFWSGIDVEFKEVGENALYLHAWWRRSTAVGADDEIEILPEVKGRGRFLGSHFAVIQKNAGDKWRWYTRPASIWQDRVEGDEKASMTIGTLDDFVCSGWWSLEKGHLPYAYAWSGRPLVREGSKGNLSVVFYRYHVQDPVWFQKSISMRVGKHRQFGAKKGPKLDESDWSTTAFFFLDQPESKLEPVQKVEVRTQGAQ